MSLLSKKVTDWMHLERLIIAAMNGLCPTEWLNAST